MKLNKLYIVILMPFLTISCTKVKSVQYYKDNIEEAYKVDKKCMEKYDKGDVLEGKFKENCENVDKAIASSMRSAKISFD